MAYRAGRHHLAPVVCENICKFVALGVSQESAAAQEGVARDTFYRWLRRGRAALQDALERARKDVPDNREPADSAVWKYVQAVDRPFVELAVGIETALGRSEAGYTLKIAKASDTDWRAAAWWLERRRPQHYGNRAELSIEREDRAPAALTNEEIAAELSALGFVQATVVEAVPTANDSVSPASPSYRKLGAIADGADGAVVRGDDDTGDNEG